MYLIPGNYQDLWASIAVQLIKNLPSNAGDAREACLKPGSGRSPGGGNSSPTPVFLPRKVHGRGGRWATIHRVTNSWTPLSIHRQAKVSRTSQMRQRVAMIASGFVGRVAKLTLKPCLLGVHAICRSVFGYLFLTIPSGNSVSSAHLFG